MNIILNFIPLKQGGGVQVGLDFLNQAKLYGTEHTWYVVATEGTPFSNYQYSDNIKLAAIIKNNLVSRLFFEYFGCGKLIAKTKANITYTQFGPTWPGSTVKNIAGCAYSNLMYPEIDFWGNLPFLMRLKRKLVDLVRTRRMLATDSLIFETEDLANRAIRIFSIDPKKVNFVRPSASSLINTLNEHAPTKKQISKIPRGFRVLLLSHYRSHKNFELLPEVASILINKHNINDVVFVITLEDDSNAQRIASIADSFGVKNNIVNIGNVAYDGCGILYDACDAVILPSLLESFSNTIAEAWIMKKPLLISDLDWAHSICEDGAIYIKYADAVDIASKIHALYTQPELINNVVMNGCSVLKKYPDPKTRFIEYKKILERVADLNQSL